MKKLFILPVLVFYSLAYSTGPDWEKLELFIKRVGSIEQLTERMAKKTCNMTSKEAKELSLQKDPATTDKCKLFIEFLKFSEMRALKIVARLKEVELQEPEKAIEITYELFDWAEKYLNELEQKIDAEDIRSQDSNEEINQNNHHTTDGRN